MIGSAPSFSVSDFVSIFNQSMDMLYPEIVITGELSNFRVSKNMWTYFDLKDEMASVKFFGTVRALPGPLEDGMMLEVVGKPYLHPQFGFSIQVRSVNVVGSGSINKAYLLLLKKLEAEGLFDVSRKRELPYAPEKIGLITSKESAAYGDFTKIMAKRWPKTEIRLFDVQVQGKDAPQQVVEALQLANQSGETLEVLVVIRGGGSKDDLASFDHEQVVRSISSSRIPTLVAIGHERDVALAEMCADARASTPSNAAEILVPDVFSEVAWVNSSSRHLDSLIGSFYDQLAREYAEYKEKFDALLAGLMNEAVVFAEYTAKLLDAYNPKTPLQRGYALPRTFEGNVISGFKQAREIANFNLEFKDGIIKVKAED